MRIVTAVDLKTRWSVLKGSHLTSKDCLADDLFWETIVAEDKTRRLFWK